jgi:cyclic beta-1,2-glucan synthetase
MAHVGRLSQWSWIPDRLKRILGSQRGPALEPIRSELFGRERFEQHGRSLGTSHRAGLARVGQPTFYPRLENSVRSLRDAYQYITDEVQEGHGVSPAAEWLLDNFHLIEAQLQEIRQGLPPRYYRSLPMLIDPPLVGLPRIYGVAWAFVAHTDSAFDETLLVHFLKGYQSTRELKLGELWALPTTLRVVLVENLRRLADRIASHKAARELAKLCAGRMDTVSLAEVESMCALMQRRGVGDFFMAHLAQYLAGQAQPATNTCARAVRDWLKTAVPDLALLQTQGHAAQAADHLSVGNAITALRLIGTSDWADTVTRVSPVISVMLDAPVFAAEDDATRSTTLHAIERLSLHAHVSESQVAKHLLHLMAEHTGHTALAAHWLQGSGRATLEAALAQTATLGGAVDTSPNSTNPQATHPQATNKPARNKPARNKPATNPQHPNRLAAAPHRAAHDAVQRPSPVAAALTHAAHAARRMLPRAFPRATVYLSSMLLASVSLVAWLLHLSGWVGAAWPTQLGLLGVGILMLLPASEAVVALVNRLISESIEPSHLPRLLLGEGIPVAARVMVVVPAMLSNASSISDVVHRLQLHYLANTEDYAQFALLSDWVDADAKEQVEDQGLLMHATAAIAALNTRYPSAAGQPSRFLLLHRSRSACATQQRWLGWERKRGKLEQLIAALATGQLGPFFDLGPLSDIAPHTRYILTLDSDTLLPPGHLRKLLGVALHPHNQPELDDTGLHVLRGYGILQPRVVPPLAANRPRTMWQWLFDGQRGIDAYSAMSSDVYQDVFGEGSFTGKGLLHVATVHAILGARLPTDQVLSHDLLEGSLVRCAVVTDVTLIEQDPPHTDAASSRQHRWTRGDWQLLPFLTRHRDWPLSAINRWKLLDNLRRSLVAPASLLLIGLSMLGAGIPLTYALALTLAAYSAGPLLGALAAWVPREWHGVGVRFVAAAALDMLRAIGGGLWHVAMLQQQALMSLDAIVRTLHRLSVSRLHLLEWTTAEAAQAGLGTSVSDTVHRHRVEPIATLAWLVALLWLTTAPSVLAVAVLALWSLAPLMVWAANKPWPIPNVMQRLMPSLSPKAGPSPADALLLHGVARDTWRFFERCVTPDEHHLPPDNLQLSPYEMVAHRTSPTNIGLYVLSAACARQLGWIGTQDLLTRLEATYASLQRLQRYRGHFFNWYDTQTLQPLLPCYVSTVDSGNLSAHLLTVAQACKALALDPHNAQASHKAIAQARGRVQPHLALLQSRLHQPLHQTAIGRLLDGALLPQLDGATPAFQGELAAARLEVDGLQHARNPAIVNHPNTAQDQLHWLLGDYLSALHSATLDAAARAAHTCERTQHRLHTMADQLEALAWAPDFAFLYHSKRHLLHIGFRLEDQHLDTSFYDLLASESRTTSLLAIAKGDVPARHWAALGRPFFASAQRAALRSWSGSMFEYLMPNLVATQPRNSALCEASRTALQEHINFVRGTTMPWGISESAYAGQDHTLAYQYAPQGVPRLALRRTPPDERVIAPYATALATLVDPALACANLRALEALGARGRYGFIEALDFTPARQALGQACTPVNTFMAHHQGMTIVALANVLCAGVAQRWGMAHPRIEALSSLLHERAPRELPALHADQNQPPTPVQRRTADSVRDVTPGAQALEPTHLMSNGLYSVALRANGAGWSRWDQIGITRWRDDALRDASGAFIYVRLPNASAPVSVTSHPAPDPQATYACHFHSDRVTFEATWPALRVHTTVWISPEDDIELRKVVLVNRGDSTLELELISALDVTLASPAGDESHPAFSNLFVTTEWLPEQQALRCVRTPRLQTETTLQAAHFVTSMEADALGLRCQTDRKQWLGRLHTPAQPLAQLDDVPDHATTLDTGLDPVAVLGVRLRIAPGAQASVTFATAASNDAPTLQSVIDKYRQPSYVERSSVMSATLAGIPELSKRSRIDYLPSLHALTTAMVLTVAKFQLDAGRHVSAAGVAADTASDGTARNRVGGNGNSNGNSNGNGNGNGNGDSDENDLSLHSDRSSLWPLGISGDRPLMLVHGQTAQGLDLLRALSLVLREWSRAGVACDVVILSRETHSYDMPLQRELSLLREQHSADLQTRRGQAVTGLHVLRADDLSKLQTATLLHLARVQLLANTQALFEQVQQWAQRFEAPAGATLGMTAAPIPVPLSVPYTAMVDATGSFSHEGRSFAFEVGQGKATPRPWVNVLANADFGTIVTESGGGNTWAINSRMNQLTPWANDPVGDPPGEHVLLQDLSSQRVWSATPSAWRAPNTSYQVQHSQGLTTISHRFNDIAVLLSWCVDADTSVKQVRVQLTNHGSATAHLRIVAMVEWIMGQQRSDRGTLVTHAHSDTATSAGTDTDIDIDIDIDTDNRHAPDDATLVGLLCTQTEAAAGFGGGTAFWCEALGNDNAAQAQDTTGPHRASSPFSLSSPSTSFNPSRLHDTIDWTCERGALFDAHGQLALPQQLGQRSGYGLDPCAALSRPLTLQPHGSVEQVFLLGYARSADAAIALMNQARKVDAQVREQATQARWDRLLDATQVQTPDPLFDAMVNRWLLYQTVSSRLWAKAGFYQAGGATGYRDQLQDAMALVWAQPDVLRAHILLCASRQFEEGDVQHWWHQPGGAGVRTHFSDDLLWLPYATTHYVNTSGDAQVLDEAVHFLQGPPVPQGDEDRYDAPAISAQTASVYEHGARAIDLSLAVGSHGLPLMGGGDWNDGMNRVGSEGRGESVWLAWFLCVIVGDWLPLAQRRGDTERAARWEQARSGWQHALNTEGWDGEWFKRAFFDDASELGASGQAEARIDLIAQAWSVLSDSTTLERQRSAMQAVQTQLVDAQHGLLRLLTPPLVHAQPSAGYIQAYPPGVRENGGQYTHAGVWGLMAAATLARRDGADPQACDTPYRYLTYLSPAHRAVSPDWGSAYGLEPYAVAADVYSAAPYTGRGGWSWYTGAAGWLHRASVESIMGLHIQGDELWLTPCLPTHWPRAELTLKRKGRIMRFVLVRGDAQATLAELRDQQANDHDHEQEQEQEQKQRRRPQANTGAQGHADSHTQLLKVGQRIHWPDIAPRMCFVVSLEDAAAPDVSNA